MDYLIVYNHQQSNFNDGQIHDTITSLPLTDWWHYLPNVYLIRSKHTEKTLADGIIARNPGLLFLIIKIDLSKANGVLNKSAWDWINNKIKDVFNLQPAPIPAQPLPKTLAQILGTPMPSVPSSQNKPPAGDLSLLLPFLKKQ